MKTRNSKNRSSKRGSALVLSMMFVVIVAGMGVCMVQLHSSQNKRQDQAIDNKRAIYIAEAGLAEGFMSLCVGQSGQIASHDDPAMHGGGYFWVDATEMDDDQVALVSTGLIGSGRFALAAVLQRQVDPIASLGFYGGTDVVVEAGALVDGYDSSEGSYEDQVVPLLESTGAGGLIGAGGDITLEGINVLGMGTNLYGDASPGTLGVVSMGLNALVSGSTAPRSSSVTFPEIEIPTTLKRADLIADSPRYRLVSGKYSMDRVEVTDGQSLILEGPAVIVVDELVLGTGSILAVDTSQGAVSLHVTGRVSVPSTSRIVNMEQDPSSLALMITATEWEDFDGDRVADNPVEFLPKGDFYGFVYAPDVDMTINSNMHFFGGMAANSLTIESGAHLTYDQALKTADLAVAGVPQLVAWRQCDVPDVPITDRSTTAAEFVKENALTPKKSSEAAAEGYFKMRYYDLNGDTQSYSGLSSTFDWSTVGEVIIIMWDDDAAVGGEGQVDKTPVALTSKTRRVRPISGKVGE